MGRKIPPANDGSNYYTARKGNRIEGVSFDEAILDEIHSLSESYFGTSGSYSRADHQHALGDIFLQGNSLYINTSGSLWTTIAPNTNTTYTIPAYTTVPSVTVSANMTWDLTSEEKMRLQEQYTLIPDDHEWNPNPYGQCEDCPHHNMYRRDPNSHLFVIQEPPSEQDWLDQLAS